MGLLPQYDKKPLTPLEEFDHQCAVRLYEVVAKHRKVMRQFRKNVWARGFTYLRSKGVSKEEITEALDWYIKNFARDDYVPKAYSGENFAEKFDKIWEGMVRDQKRNPTLTETPTGKKVMAELRHLRWKNGVGDQLPAFVEQSIKAYDAFTKKLLDWRIAQTFKGNPDAKRQQLFRFSVQVAAHLQTAEQFIPKWFKAVWEWAHKKGYTLKELHKWSFTADHKQFHEWGRGWASKYGDSKLWDKLMEAVNG